MNSFIRAGPVLSAARMSPGGNVGPSTCVSDNQTANATSLFNDDGIEACLNIAWNRGSDRRGSSRGSAWMVGNADDRIRYVAVRYSIALSLLPMPTQATANHQGATNLVFFSC